MGKRAALFFILLMGLLTLSLSIPVHAAGAAASAQSWQTSIIDQNGNVGQFLSLALQPGTQKPYISYYDITNKDLKLAFPVSGAGDCGPGNSWSCNSLFYQNTDDFGDYSSIGFNSLGQWGIAYSSVSPETSNNFRGIPQIGKSDQIGKGIDTQPNFPMHLANVLRYDPSGIAHIAFIALDSTYTPYLRYASYVGSFGNCGVTGQWQCDTIAPVSLHGIGLTFSNYVDLFLDGYLPTIVYRDVDDHLALAAYLASGIGNCGPALYWRCDVIDSTVLVGGYLSVTNQLANNAGGIAYIDQTTHTLRYANTVGSGGNCGQGWQAGVWNCTTIETVGSATQYIFLGASLAVRDGQPLIAYTHADSLGHFSLKAAYPQAGGNCGGSAWRCEVVDDGGGVKDVGEYPSLAVGKDDTTYIAYYNASDGQLKLAIAINQRVFLPMLAQ